MKSILCTCLFVTIGCNVENRSDIPNAVDNQTLPPAPIAEPRALSAHWFEIYHHGGRPIVDMTFANESQGWAVFDWTYVLNTGDGGATWKNATGMPPCNRLRSISFRNQTDVYVVGGDFNSEQTGPPELLKRTAEDNWTKVNSTFNSRQNLRFNKIRWATDRTGFILGRELIITSDSGKSWELVSLGQYPITDAVFQGDNEAWYVSGTKVFYSPDRCRTWIPRANVESLVMWQDKESLLRIIAASPKSLWAVGSKGSLLRSLDGGTEWSIATRFPRDCAVNDMQFVTNQSGWAILAQFNRTKRWMIIHTKDGGSHWVREWECERALECLFFLNEGLGWAAGEVIVRYER